MNSTAPPCAIQHVQGWRYQLSVFSNVVADEINADAAGAIDSWFDAWAEPDAAAREKTLTRIAAANLSFHDRYSNIGGLAELFPHIAAAMTLHAGMRMKRPGDVCATVRERCSPISRSSDPATAAR